MTHVPADKMFLFKAVNRLADRQTGGAHGIAEAAKRAERSGAQIIIFRNNFSGNVPVDNVRRKMARAGPAAISAARTGRAYAFGNVAGT